MVIKIKSQGKYFVYYGIDKKYNILNLLAICKKVNSVIFYFLERINVKDRMLRHET